MATNLRLGVGTKATGAKSPVLQGRRGANSIAPRDATFGARNAGRNVRHDAENITGSRARGAKVADILGPRWP